MAADGWSDEAMQEVARGYGQESGFVLAGTGGTDFDLRFWVPNHEMEMCGHATVAAVWLLNGAGLLDKTELVLGTKSGPVRARVGEIVEVSQPPGRLEPVVQAEEILDVLRITPDQLADKPIVNAATSRVKTCIPLVSTEVLDALQPDFNRVEALCARIGSTGLYPYAVTGPQLLSARQFPRSSGYPEDAATGIAAAALAYAALDAGLVEPTALVVRQGFAMGRPSVVHLRFAEDGCWLGGHVEF